MIDNKFLFVATSETLLGYYIISYENKNSIQISNIQVQYNFT